MTAFNRTFCSIHDLFFNTKTKTIAGQWSSKPRLWLHKVTWRDNRSFVCQCDMLPALCLLNMMHLHFRSSESLPKRNTARPSAWPIMLSVFCLDRHTYTNTASAGIASDSVCSVYSRINWTRSSAAAKSTAHRLCLVGVLYYQMLKTAQSYLHSSGQNTGTWWTDKQNCSS